MAWARDRRVGSIIAADFPHSLATIATRSRLSKLRDGLLRSDTNLIEWRAQITKGIGFGRCGPR